MKITTYMSHDTVNMITALNNKAILKWSKIYTIPESLLFAMIGVESNYNTLAIRLEPHLKKVKWYNKTLYGVSIKEDYHYCSFGLMQIMFGNAKHLGMVGSPFNLFNPDINLKYAGKFLRNLLNRYKWVVEDAVSAYNQGNNRFYDLNKNGIKDENEKYYNQQYVDKVIKLYRKDN